PGAPGGGTGRLRREGAYTAVGTSVHNFDIAGTGQGTTYDFFDAAGAITLAGTLNVSLSNAFVPAAGSVYPINSRPSLSRPIRAALPHTLGYARIQYTPTAVKIRIPLCPVDWNGDGVTNSQDFFDFLADFFAGNSDFNFDGVNNSQDFFDFLTSFFGGCTG